MHNASNPFQNPTTISFCTGLRQLDAGCERVTGTHRTAIIVEIEAFIIWNLANQMEKGLLDPAPIWIDAKTFPAERFSNKIHGILAGYPCPGESTAGLRKLWEDERFIWPYLEKSIRTIKPVWCFFENVEGHLSGSFPIIFRHLRNLGYRVEAGIFSAREVGAPQERRRVFILAVADTFCNAAGGKSGGTFRKSKAHEAQAREENGERSGFVTTGGGEDMEHTSGFLCRALRGNGGKEISIISNSGGELGYTIGTGREGNYEQASGGWRWSSEPDNKLENPDQFRNRRGQYEKPLKKRKVQIEGPGVMADSGYTAQQLPIEWGITTKQVLEFARAEGITLWPAGQGYYQYEYEPSRTTKSNVEFAFNGYNFRDDLLRGIGNGVLPDVAEKAFRVLMAKHGLSHLID